jgi:hypothetical protein
MRMQRLLISHLLVMPLFVILLVVLLAMSWTIEKFQLKK